MALLVLFDFLCVCVLLWLELWGTTGYLRASSRGLLEISIRMAPNLYGTYMAATSVERILSIYSNLARSAVLHELINLLKIYTNLQKLREKF